MLTLLVFARAPVAGRCKTRLIPRLGARGAAWVQKRLVEQVLRVAKDAHKLLPQPMQVVLCNTPQAVHPFFRQCQQIFDVRLARQPGGDLGQRMRGAIAQWLPQGPVLLVGSDAFGLLPQDLLDAASALQQQDYVLTPATDGGYVLIGAAKALPSLAGVSWSSGRERMQTLRRLRAVGRVALTTHARADFDTPGDWQRARRAGRLPPLRR